MQRSTLPHWNSPVLGSPSDLHDPLPILPSYRPPDRGGRPLLPLEVPLMPDFLRSEGFLTGWILAWGSAAALVLCGAL